MSSAQNDKTTLSGKSGSEFEVLGIKVKCPHCGSTFFSKRKVSLNTALLSFLGLDKANKAAVVLLCTSCGRVELFFSNPEEIKS